MQKFLSILVGVIALVGGLFIGTGNAETQAIPNAQGPANVVALPNAPIGELQIVPGKSYTIESKRLAPMPDAGYRWAAPIPDTCGAANCAGWNWQSESYTEYFVQDSVRQYVKLVSGVIAYRPSDDQSNNSVQQLNAQCQVRNMNTAYTSGVKVTRCALGYDGGAAVSVNDTDVLDGGTCCANSQAFPVGARFCSFCNSFRGRTDVQIRWRADGKLYAYTSLSRPTDRAFALT